jgi:hypothetical protein
MKLEKAMHDLEVKNVNWKLDLEVKIPSPLFRLEKWDIATFGYTQM